MPAAYVEPVVQVRHIRILPPRTDTLLLDGRSQAAPCVIPPVAPDENIALAGVVTSVVGPLVIVQARDSCCLLDCGMPCD